MTSSLFGLIAGFVFALVLWTGLTEMFNRPAFLRRNYRNREVATSAGVVTVAAVFFTAAVLGAVEALGFTRLLPGLESVQKTALLAGGFGLLGLLDDLAMDENTSGYRGHIRAVLSGKLSAGALKLVAGPAIALVAVQSTSGRSFYWLLIDGAIVALAANLANLLDRAPGRVTKASAIAVLALFIATAIPYIDGSVRLLPNLAGVSTILGGSFALFVPELREKLMLGDAGANALGASIGLAVVMTQSAGVKLGVLAALVFLNLISERVSFSAVIQRVGVLRSLDNAGRIQKTG